MFAFINSLNLHQKKTLEIGCGSGLLSLLAARKGAIITAIDKNERAVKNTRLNFELNFGTAAAATILQSDLFSNLPEMKYDVVIINPPYFFKTISSDESLAWNCGTNGEYFEALFEGLFSFVAPTGQVFIILADNCDIKRIKSMAERNKIYFTLVEEKKIKWETNYIYQLRHTQLS